MLLELYIFMWYITTSLNIFDMQMLVKSLSLIAIGFKKNKEKYIVKLEFKECSYQQQQTGSVFLCSEAQ